MRFQYNLIVSVRHNGNLCKNVVIFSCRCVESFDLSQFLNKGMVLLMIPKNSILDLNQNYTMLGKKGNSKL